MPGISIDALAGYILEEVLAYLLRNTGYRLLTDASQDSQELANRGNGLVVRGRGAEHQVDVLGELLWVPAFTFPLRLILEAKCRKWRTSIDTVRGMMAALADINQNNVPSRHHSSKASSPPPRKYTYVGAIFSASGFSSPAADFALAHAISLVDLNDVAFSGLVKAVQAAASAFSEKASRDAKRSTGHLVKRLRQYLRSALHTESPNSPRDFFDDLLFVGESLVPAVDAATDMMELFIGTAAGPYMLVLKADDPLAFMSYAREHPAHEVEIHWSALDNEGLTWHIQPLYGRKYRLSFRLPQRLADWIFDSRNPRRVAMTAKGEYFSNISIYRHTDDGDQLVRLNYEPRQIQMRRS